MTSWQLHPKAIRSVLDRAAMGRATLAETFSQSAVESLEGPLTWSPLCADVVTALSELVNGGHTDFLATVETVDAAIEGVANAAVAYHTAGAEMAGVVEAAAVEAVLDRNFASYGQGGGAS